MTPLSAALAILVAAAPPAASPTNGVTVDDELRRAKNEYAYGNYDSAVEQLEALLYPMRLYSDSQVIDARKYLALSHYLLDHEEEARQEFSKILFLNPDYRLDPFTIAPPIIEMFEQLRTNLKPQLDGIRVRREEKTTQVGFRRTIVSTVTEKSDIATLMPFGVGQFQNRDYGWGVAFALIETALLVLNVGSYLWGRELRDTQRVDGRRGYNPDDAGLVQTLLVTQFASAALFGITWGIGVFHARLNFVPVEIDRSVTDEPLGGAQSARPMNLGAVFSLSF